MDGAMVSGPCPWFDRVVDYDAHRSASMTSWRERIRLFLLCNSYVDNWSSVCLSPVCSGDKTDLCVILSHHQNLHLGLGAVRKA